MITKNIFNFRLQRFALCSSSTRSTLPIHSQALIARCTRCLHDDLKYSIWLWSWGLLSKMGRDGLSTAMTTKLDLDS